MSITGYDVSVLPALLFFGAIALVGIFFVDFVINLIGIVLIQKFQKRKINFRMSLLASLVHTFIVGILEIAALFFAVLETTQVLSYEVSYMLLSFAAIFVVFRTVVPRFVPIGGKSMNLSSTIMAIVTNPGLVLLLLTLL
jgi:hypothetical protein